MITTKIIKDDVIKTKRYKYFYNINKLFFLSYYSYNYYDYNGSDYKNINYFLSEDEILDNLDYYYFNKDFIDYNSSYEIYSYMSFKEYIKTLQKEI